jgi:hypothetical protein
VAVLDEGLTRRRALARLAFVVGGAAATRWAPVAVAAVTPAPGFTTERQSVFRALIEAYDGQGPIVSSGRDLAAEMQARYSSGSSDYTTWVDALLDALESAPAGPRFSVLTVKARRSALRSWNQATEPDDALMHVSRPTEADEPTDLMTSNERTASLIRQFRATLPADALDLDPTTLLPKYAPVTPPGPPITRGGPLDTVVRLRRYIRHSCYVLLVSFFVDDTRYLTDEAFA